MVLAAPTSCVQPLPLTKRPTDSPPIRYGAIMPELGRRFELLGRAAKARRFELASYEVHEIEEMFEDDLSHAAQPGEVKTSLLPFSSEFLNAEIPPLRAAARSADGPGLASAFRSAAASCNACHSAADKAFIAIPSEAGLGVPRAESD